MLKSTLFQLRESNNLERVIFLIERLTASLGRFDTDTLLKIDSALYETVSRQLEGKYATPTVKQSLIYAIAVLRYVLQRQSLRNLPQLIQLINQAASSGDHHDT
ncbi:unnamed protein product [Sphagnum jensenii]